jgi:hypothetical protein
MRVHLSGGEGGAGHGHGGHGSHNLLLLHGAHRLHGAHGLHGRLRPSTLRTLAHCLCHRGVDTGGHQIIRIPRSLAATTRGEGFGRGSARADIDAHVKRLLGRLSLHWLRAGRDLSIHAEDNPRPRPSPARCGRRDPPGLPSKRRRLRGESLGSARRVTSTQPQPLQWPRTFLAATEVVRRAVCTRGARGSSPVQAKVAAAIVSVVWAAQPTPRSVSNYPLARGAALVRS